MIRSLCLHSVATAHKSKNEVAKERRDGSSFRRFLLKRGKKLQLDGGFRTIVLIHVIEDQFLAISILWPRQIPRKKTTPIRSDVVDSSFDM